MCDRPHLSVCLFLLSFAPVPISPGLVELFVPRGSISPLAVYPHSFSPTITPPLLASSPTGSVTLSERERAIKYMHRTQFSSSGEPSVLRR